MKAKILDPRGRKRKRTTRTIRRFLSVVGLLPRAAARCKDRHDPGDPRERVPVWDAARGAFRDVDPDNRHDPLHEPARQLASLRAALSRDGPSSHSASPTDPAPHAAAVRDRQADDPPRSPFGGGNCVAIDDCDV